MIKYHYIAAKMQSEVCSTDHGLHFGGTTFKKLLDECDCYSTKWFLAPFLISDKKKFISFLDLVIPIIGFFGQRILLFLGWTYWKKNISFNYSKKRLGILYLTAAVSSFLNISSLYIIEFTLIFTNPTSPYYCFCLLLCSEPILQEIKIAFGFAHT